MATKSKVGVRCVVVLSKRVILIICLLVIALTTGIVYTSSPRQQARAAAAELFKSEGKGACVEVWDTIGFASQEEANQAYLSDPIQVFMLGDSVSDNQSLIDQTIAAPIYLFPIYANGRCVTEMEVKLRDGDWVLGAIGGHKAAYQNELAHANAIEPTDLKLIRFGPFTAFTAIKDGKEIGSIYQKDAKDFIMTAENLSAFKEKVKSFINAVDVNSADKVIISEGQANNPEYAFKQNDSIAERLGRYVRYGLVFSIKGIPIKHSLLK